MPLAAAMQKRGSRPYKKGSMVGVAKGTKGRYQWLGMFIGFHIALLNEETLYLSHLLTSPH